MHGDRIGHLEDLLDRHAFDTVKLGRFVGDVGVEAGDTHAQGTSAVRDSHADLAQADDAERLSDELPTHERRTVPLAGVHRGIGCRHVASQREEQRERVLGGRGGVARGGVDHGDAGRGCGGDVDVVDTHTGAADDEQLAAGSDRLGIGLDATAHQQRLVFGQGREVLLTRHAHPHVDAVLFLQEGHALGCQLLSDENLHQRASSPARRAAAGPAPCSMERPIAIEPCSMISMAVTMSSTLASPRWPMRKSLSFILP